MIQLALWLLKRSPVGGGVGNNVMRSIAVLPISQSQRIVTIEVGSGEERRWLVLGVTPQNITTLHSMAPQDDALATPVAAMPPMPFSQLLSRLRQDKGSSGER